MAVGASNFELLPAAMLPAVWTVRSVVPVIVPVTFSAPAVLPRKIESAVTGPAIVPAPEILILKTLAPAAKLPTVPILWSVRSPFTRSAPVVEPVSVPTVMMFEPVRPVPPVARRSSVVATPVRSTLVSNVIDEAVAVGTPATVTDPSRRTDADTPAKSAVPTFSVVALLVVKVIALAGVAGAISTIPELAWIFPPDATLSVSVCKVISLPDVGADTTPAAPTAIVPNVAPEPIPLKRLTEPPDDATVPNIEINGEAWAAGGLDGPAPPVAKIISPVAATL